MQKNSNLLPVNEVKVIDRVIDVYLWCCDLNTDEIRLLGQRLIDLADRRATDVEMAYIERYQYTENCESEYVPKEDLPMRM